MLRRRCHEKKEYDLDLHNGLTVTWNHNNAHRISQRCHEQRVFEIRMDQRDRGEGRSSHAEKAYVGFHDRQRWQLQTRIRLDA